MTLLELLEREWQTFDVHHEDGTVTLDVDGEQTITTMEQYIDALTDYACTPHPDFSRVTQMVEEL